MAYITYIQDEDHYTKVIEKAASVKKSLWIGTADIKDLHVKAGNSSEPFLGVLAELLKRGVDVRLIHAKEPCVHAFTLICYKTPGISIGDLDFAPDNCVTSRLEKVSLSPTEPASGECLYSHILRECRY